MACRPGAAARHPSEAWHHESLARPRRSGWGRWLSNGSAGVCPSRFDGGLLLLLLLVPSFAGAHAIRSGGSAVPSHSESFRVILAVSHRPGGGRLCGPSHLPSQACLAGAESSPETATEYGSRSLVESDVRTDLMTARFSAPRLVSVLFLVGLPLRPTASLSEGRAGRGTPSDGRHSVVVP
jgi:hypothetical protein